MWQEKEIEIFEIEGLLASGYDVEVDSPDGYIPVNFFIHKGQYEEHILISQNDEFVPVRCNADHLFETTVGWASAGQLVGKGAVNVLTKNGYVKGEVIRTGETIPIVDINVEHENHRYYTNSVSSHNTGVGKSLAMCHMATANLLLGKNVLYITMEMAEEKIAQRIDANMLNVTVDSLLELSKDMFQTKVAKAKGKTSGKLIIKEYPTASAGSGHFRHLLNELRLKKSFVPDIIYIDYLNICTSSRVKAGAQVNSYMLVKAIAEELRGLAVEFNVPVVSATQTTRSGYGNSDVELTDTSESFGLPATADFMIALISSEQLEDLNQLMIKQLKNRYGDPSYHKRFVVGVDRAKMRLYDVEQSAQEDLIDDHANGNGKRKKPEKDVPLFDQSGFGKRAREDDMMGWATKTMGRKDFSGLKV